MKQLTILGATGSIGDSTLAVVDLHPDKFNIFALAANKNWQKMQKLCEKYQPEYVVMQDEAAAEKLQQNLDNDSIILGGNKAISMVASHSKTDFVMAAIVGTAGISSTLAAASAGKRIMLANKESLVLAGGILLREVQKSGAELIPVDSEHSAIFQCLTSGKSGLDKIQLTASGGPFLTKPLAEMSKITPAEACNHPNWDMGQKISVDSATMMNKGLEVIEAHYLFGLPSAKIEVLIHPQSIVHSSVYYEDGCVLSQLGKPDMRSAVAYAMAYPQRISAGVESLDLTKKPLEFYQPDLKKFTCLKLAFEALDKGFLAIGAINAANEIAVQAFLDSKIGFLEIPKIIEKTMSLIKTTTTETLDTVLENDQNAKEIARELLN